MENKRPLILSDVEAKRIYKTASPELKIILEDTFGKEFFSQKVTERIKTYEDACAELGITPICENTLLKNGFTKGEIAYRKVKTIIQVLNEGWQADWNNEYQDKWIPWFSPWFYHGSIVGLAYVSSTITPSSMCTNISSRFCLKNEELAIYMGKRFVDLYKEFII